MRPQICLMLLAVLLPLSLQANTSNIDLVDGVWLSTDQPLSDTPTRIYTAIRNNTENDVTGQIVFYVEGKKLSGHNVQVPTGRVIEAWADWTPVAGTSTVEAVFTDAQITPVGEEAKPLETDTRSSEEIFVDIDTDNDGIGDQIDTDDDNDGITDIEEKEAGTDPLVADSAASEATGDGDPVSSKSGSNGDTDKPIGLEQYLTNSRARSTLAGITETVNSTKKRLDEYREYRDQNMDKSEGRDDEGGDIGSSTETYTDGFGEITRSHNDGGLASVFGAVFSVLKAALSGLYTFILLILSLFLGHPAVVQLSLLILILTVLFKMAKRFGSRPQ